MTDRISVQQRSSNMARVRCRDTQPELVIRSLLHRMGYRFRLHRNDLPGKPDIVLPGRRRIIFVHGCFWHSHEGCRRARVPKTRTEFWTKKLNTNRDRDHQMISKLADLGWATLVVWECELKDNDKLGEKLLTFLGSARR